MKNIEIQNLRFLAKCWNNLDIRFLEDRLTRDFVYESQWVLTPIKGSLNFLSYLSRKFNAIKQAMLSEVMSVSAEIAYCPDLANRPCLVLTQITNESLREVTILVDTKGNKISRIQVCFIPNPSDTLLTGENPK